MSVISATDSTIVVDLPDSTHDGSYLLTVFRGYQSTNATCSTWLSSRRAPAGSARRPQGRHRPGRRPRATPARRAPRATPAPLDPRATPASPAQGDWRRRTQGRHRRDGRQGRDRATGPKGDTGATGAAGPRSAAPWALGEVGPQVLRVRNWPAGATGAQGAAGPQAGPQGRDRGNAGPAGPQAETGSTAPRDPQVPQGDGSQGPDGPQGHRPEPRAPWGPRARLPRRSGWCRRLRGRRRGVSRGDDQRKPDLGGVSRPARLASA